MSCSEKQASPARGVSFARVNLRIPGLMDRQPHGLYSVVVDKRFLKHRYGSALGLLLKPSTFGSFRYPRRVMGTLRDWFRAQDHPDRGSERTGHRLCTSGEQDRR